MKRDSRVGRVYHVSVCHTSRVDTITRLKAASFTKEGSCYIFLVDHSEKRHISAQHAD